MAKIVTYTGATGYVGGSDPTILEEGMRYKVISEKNIKGQTFYTLEGLSGNFNSIWFNRIPVTTEYLAFSDQIPVAGKSAVLSREKDKRWEKVETSKVIEVVQLGYTMYKVSTENSTYFLQVHK